MKEVVSDRCYDVLVIGAGGAGCAAAIEAQHAGKRVALLTAGAFADSKTARSQGCFQAVFDADDSIDAHVEDTLEAGERNNKEALVRILCERSVKTIRWLEALGVTFRKSEAGDFCLDTAGGLSHPRIVRCEYEGGKHIVDVLGRSIRGRDIDLFEHTPVNRLAAEAGGFLVCTDNNEAEALSCKSIVLATGGIVPHEKSAGLGAGSVSNTNGIEKLSEDLGLEIKGLELMQYHPTGIVLPKALRRKNVPEYVRGAGAPLLNKYGQSFVDPLLTRSQVCEAIVNECARGNGVETDDGRRGVWLDTPSIDRERGEGYCARHFSGLDAALKATGCDMSEEPLLVFPSLHYSLGGVVIDAHAQTSHPGVFAAGEATYGVHGEDRLAGNSLLELFVFGRLAGTNAARYADGLSPGGVGA